MHGRGWLRVGLLGVGMLLTSAGDAAAAGPGRPAETVRKGSCLRAVLEGEVRAGEGFQKGFGGGLAVVLEPIAAGWVVRVLPERGVRPKEDYAEIATPPYRSVSPLLLSTDYSFRAQDVVGWNPRRFRYAGSGRAFAVLEPAYEGVVGTKTPTSQAEAALAALVATQPEGMLEIVDASLAPGTADPTRGAALVATHFSSTAHEIEPPKDGRATALGRIGSLRFRVKLDLLPGVKPGAGVSVERYVCGRG